MTVQIVEFIERSVQGMTEPFICRGDDGEIYFVKGIGATRQSQIYEWIVGNLALELGLPIAPFEIVDVPDELIESNQELAELGSGPAFGSCKQIITELNFAGLSEIPLDVQRDVLAFDWWVRNDDRTLSEFGGNPNLFWDATIKELVVIDHNQAFDPDFDKENFHKFHVFSSIQLSLFGDFDRRQKYAENFNRALGSWKSICDRIPDEWYYADKEMTVSADIDINGLLDILQLCNKDKFWEQS